MAPVAKKFGLSARVSSDNPAAIKRVLEQAAGGHCRITAIDGGFEVRGELEGESARDLNRNLLSEMRRVEKRTRIRSEWTSGKTIEKFFDYVPKGTKTTQT